LLGFIIKEKKNIVISKMLGIATYQHSEPDNLASLEIAFGISVIIRIIQCNKTGKKPFPMIDNILNSSEQDDALLIEKAQSGDVDAFGELYGRYAATIFRFIYSQSLHRLDAEDLSAEVFLKAWQALPRYQNQGFSFSPNFCLTGSETIQAWCYF